MSFHWRREPRGRGRTSPFRTARLTRIGVWCLLCGATTSALQPEPAHAQQFHVGGGAGYSVAADGLDDRSFTGFVGFETDGRVGARIEGMDTISLVFLTGNITFTLGALDRTVQPYLIGGAGEAFDFDSADPTVNAGLGFRVQSRHFAIFSEARVVHLIDTARPQPTIFPLLGGIRVIF